MNTRHLLLLLAAMSGLARAEMPAAPAEQFMDSIGVCTHWSYSDTPYGMEFDRVAAMLVQSGIRHIRDGLSDRMIELGKVGIRATVVLEPTRSIEDWLGAIRKANAAGARIVAVEGPNEPDLFWLEYARNYPPGTPAPTNVTDVIEGVTRFQRDLFAAVKADPALRSLTVIGPALGRTYGYDVRSPFREGSLADAVDWGNFHHYPGGNPFTNRFTNKICPETGA
ncbi:MAG: hypothetical protein H7A43_11955 [Verrucomicrobia bacterium]|nr:hypothetical protein [Kiritimatiellia bacterium]MCP5489348.1 hypothetical protein [Verrucomicrobiota bacterium]